LAVCGVKIVTTATIRSTEVLHGTLRQVAVQTSEDTLIFSNVARVLWTAGISSLARTLALSVPSTPIKIHRRNAIVNLLISEPPNMEDLYYYWGFDRNYRTFRVTNFANYCPSAQRADGYPVAVELFLHPEDPTGTEGVLSLAIKELEAFGVLRPDSKIVFHKSQVLNGGFPVLSAQSKRLHQDTSAAIASLDLKNLVISGMQASWGLILQPDVLKHTFAEIHRSFGA